MTLDADLASLRDAAPPPPADLAAMRERVRAGTRLCAGGPRDVETRSESFDGVSCRVYEHGALATTLVYAHGGGWTTGDLDYADEFCRGLAARGIRIVSVDYALAPEHPFPTALGELATVLAAVRERFGRSVVLGGDSAGANLAAVVGVENAATALVLIYPALDAGMRTASYDDADCAFPIGRGAMTWFYEQYAPHGDPDDIRLSPGRRPVGVDHPPTLVATAGHDPLRDEGVAYADALAAAGIVTAREHFPGLCHGFLRFTGASPASAAARDRLIDAVSSFVAALEPQAGERP